MPFSSVLGASSVIKPGVCTSATRPTVPFVGQLIFETDTNRLVVWNGSSWIYLVDSDSPPGLQLIKTQTIGTAVTSVEVTDAFSADFENYRIILSGGLASGDTNLELTLGTTTSGYYRWGVYGVYSTTTVNGINSSNAANWGDFFGGTTNSLNGTVEIMQPFASKNTSVSCMNMRTATNGFFVMQGGYLANTTSYTSFKLTCNPGTNTLTGGTIRVYGYRNS